MLLLKQKQHESFSYCFELKYLVLNIFYSNTIHYFRFKAKVGLNVEDDKRRLNLIRKEIGYDNLLVSIVIKRTFDFKYYFLQQSLFTNVFNTNI